MAAVSFVEVGDYYAGVDEYHLYNSSSTCLLRFSVPLPKSIGLRLSMLTFSFLPSIHSCMARFSASPMDMSFLTAFALNALNRRSSTFLTLSCMTCNTCMTFISFVEENQKVLRFNKKQFKHGRYSQSMRVPKVILLAGPSGSGKSSTAERIAKNKGWVHLSEDDFWADFKKDTKEKNIRHPKEQGVVQPRVLGAVKDAVSKGKNVVLEFILYEVPPVPLLFYKNALEKEHVNLFIRVFRPSVDSILARQRVRGRARDKRVKEKRMNAEHQLACLRAKEIKKEWIIDNPDDDLETIYKVYFEPIVTTR